MAKKQYERKVYTPPDKSEALKTAGVAKKVTRLMRERGEIEAELNELKEEMQPMEKRAKEILAELLEIYRAAGVEDGLTLSGVGNFTRTTYDRETFKKEDARTGMLDAGLSARKVAAIMKKATKMVPVDFIKFTAEKEED